MLMAVHQGPTQRSCGLAWLSVTQGVVRLAECAPDEVAEWIAPHRAQRAGLSARRAPPALKSASNACAARARWPRRCTRPPCPNGSLTAPWASANCCDDLQAASLDQLERARTDPSPCRQPPPCCGYAERTQGRRLTARPQRAGAARRRTPSTYPPPHRRNLELTQTLRGEDSAPRCSPCSTPA